MLSVSLIQFQQMTLENVFCDAVEPIQCENKVSISARAYQQNETVSNGSDKDPFTTLSQKKGALQA